MVTARAASVNAVLPEPDEVGTNHSSPARMIATRYAQKIEASSIHAPRQTDAQARAETRDHGAAQEACRPRCAAYRPSSLPRRLRRCLARRRCLAPAEQRRRREATEWRAREATRLAKAGSRAVAKAGRRRALRKRRGPKSQQIPKSPSHQISRSPNHQMALDILMVASEARPFAKTGGLADVCGALPRALARLGHRVTIVLPRYRGTPPTGPRRAGRRARSASTATRCASSSSR